MSDCTVPFMILCRRHAESIWLAASQSVLTLWSLCFWLINHATVILSRPQTLTDTNCHEASLAYSETQHGMEIVQCRWNLLCFRTEAQWISVPNNLSLMFFFLSYEMITVKCWHELCCFVAVWPESSSIVQYLCFDKGNLVTSNRYMSAELR